MKGRFQNNRCGLTLIEVILAMTIFSLIAAILYGALYLSRRAAIKGILSAETSQRERMLGSFLAGYVRSAFPYRASAQDQSIFFYGEESRLTFVSALSRGLGGRGLAKVTVQWEGQQGDPLTLEEEMPVRFAEQQEGLGYRNRVVLYPAVDGLQIEYLPAEGDEAGWVEQWDGAEKKSLPRAIRVRLRAAGGERKQWVVPIMMEALVR
ncbi:MAG: prepilin-type N-terminal cleavage/methylation domain-containing protein [Candidatus Binatia bacterium]